MQGARRARLEPLPGLSCEALLAGAPRGLLLLHGYSFRHHVWLEAGVVDWALSRGLGVAAPDMPYGRSTSCTRRTRSLEVNLAVAEAAVREAPLGEVVAVGASMGARYAIHVAASWRHAVGLVLVGPALGREPGPVLEALRSARARGVEVLVVVGSRDRGSIRLQAEEAAGAAGAELAVVKGAGHVVHRDKPGEFLELLAGLLGKIGWA